MRLFISGSEENIIQELHKLREHSYIPKSHFAVAAIIRVILPDGRKVYYGGVNVELPGNNCTAMHAEQTAFASALSDETDVILDSVWVMGGIEAATANNHLEAGNKHIQPCGHCRQLLFNRPENGKATIYSVAINENKIPTSTHTLSDLLPCAFNQEDLAKDNKHTDRAYTDPASSARCNATQWTGYEPQSYMQPGKQLSTQEINSILRKSKPFVIDLNHELVPTTVCIMRVADNKAYGLGVLVQEAGFQTTPAFSSTIASLIARKGVAHLQIDEVHLYSPTDVSPGLSMDELAMLSIVSHEDVKIHLYNQSGFIKALNIEAYFNVMAKTQLESLYAHSHSPIDSPTLR